MKRWQVCENADHRGDCGGPRGDNGGHQVRWACSVGSGFADEVLRVFGGLDVG